MGTIIDKHELFMPVDINIKLESVILSDENREKVTNFLMEHEHRHEFVKYGLVPVNKLLFYGASGTGKTYLAKAICNHIDYRMLYIDIAKSLSTGEAAINISRIFEVANETKNCVIFLDECDSIAWNRDNDNSDGGDIRRATNTLFQYLDQMDYTNVFISATNLLHRIDPAFERRFGEKLEFRRPQLNMLESIQKFVLPKFTVENDVDSTQREIVERRAVLSYSEIKNILEKAMKRAIIEGTTVLRTSDIYRDIAIATKIKVKFGTDSDNEVIFKTSKV